MTSQDTGRSLRRATSCSKSPQLSASCDLKLPLATGDSHQRRQREFYPIFTLEPQQESLEPERWKTGEEERTEATFWLFFSSLGVRKDEEAFYAIHKAFAETNSHQQVWNRNLFQRNQRLLGLYLRVRPSLSWTDRCRPPSPLWLDGSCFWHKRQNISFYREMS